MLENSIEPFEPNEVAVAKNQLKEERQQLQDLRHFMKSLEAHAKKIHVNDFSNQMNKCRSEVARLKLSKGATDFHYSAFKRKPVPQGDATSEAAVRTCVPVGFYVRKDYDNHVLVCNRGAWHPASRYRAWQRHSFAGALKFVLSWTWCHRRAKGCLTAFEVLIAGLFLERAGGSFRRRSCFCRHQCRGLSAALFALFELLFVRNGCALRLLLNLKCCHIFAHYST